MSLTGAVDGHGIVGRNPVGRTAALATFMGRPITLTRAFTTQWSRVAAHLASGIRLQQRLAHAARRPCLRTNAAHDSITRACCASVISGNIGSASTQPHASSAMGKSPAR